MGQARQQRFRGGGVHVRGGDGGLEADRLGGILVGGGGGVVRAVDLREQTFQQSISSRQSSVAEHRAYARVNRILRG